jgi:D-alanyl-D-alanine carboxypeptidase/D-alanyl-D-alanine-endopeptidase (penicillin-binding protein 4)
MRSATAYDAPLASIGTDFGTWCVDVRHPRRKTGRGNRLHHALADAVQHRVDHRVQQSALRVERLTIDGDDTLRIGGTWKKAQTLYRAMPDPHAAPACCCASLLDMGIQLAGGVAVEDGTPPAAAYMVAKAQGLSLKEQLADAALQQLHR